MFASTAVTAVERSTRRPGDDVVDPADVVMDRAIDVTAAPEAVWPWIVQLGKQRGGWYLTRRVEHVVPRSRRALRHVDPRWQGVVVGDVVPDWGGADATFRVLSLDPGRSLVYGSQRGRTDLTWSITLEPTVSGTRIFFRLRLAPVRRRWLANSLGEFFDALTITGLAGGLRERLPRSA